MTGFAPAPGAVGEDPARAAPGADGAENVQVAAKGADSATPYQLTVHFE